MNYNTINSIPLVFAVSTFTGELGGVLRYPELFSASFVAVNIVTGSCGFLIALATFIQIKVTSPLTNAISGTAKACTQTILSIIIWSSKVGFLVHIYLFSNN